MGGKFHDSIRKSVFYTNLGADRRGFDRNARIESPKHSLRFQLGHGFGSGMRKKELAAKRRLRWWLPRCNRARLVALLILTRP
jgi:hypothetical protein